MIASDSSSPPVCLKNMLSLRPFVSTSHAFVCGYSYSGNKYFERNVTFCIFPSFFYFWYLIATSWMKVQFGVFFTIWDSIGRQISFIFLPTGIVRYMLLPPWQQGKSMKAPLNMWSIFMIINLKVRGSAVPGSVIWVKSESHISLSQFTSHPNDTNTHCGRKDYCKQGK